MSTARPLVGGEPGREPGLAATSAGALPPRGRQAVLVAPAAIWSCATSICLIRDRAKF